MPFSWTALRAAEKDAVKAPIIKLNINFKAEACPTTSKTILLFEYKAMSALTSSSIFAAWPAIAIKLPLRASGRLPSTGFSTYLP